MLCFRLCIPQILGVALMLTPQASLRAAPDWSARSSQPGHFVNPIVSIGPDLLTFPEIANKLSVGGHTVVCSPSLRQRAAFVYLKSRPWDRACSWLAQGLQCQFDAPL